MKTKTIYIYRGTEYPTRYEAMDAVRCEARIRVRKVSEEAQNIRKIIRKTDSADRETHLN